MTSYNKWDVVVIPFPFSDIEKSKKRPVVILSDNLFNKENGHSIMAMITTSKTLSWLGDVGIKNLAKAGLNIPSILRPKIFTLDNRLIIKKIGQFAENDIKHVKVALKSVIM